ncbi:NAD(P)/FAD-dependent oxidoreductase [Aestuariivirga sp.]|uniref:flavin-dependent monooxygenase QhpG n=1 Tax=Aestuariivirga sp. TaxID=2650926 RepID=UPI00391D1CD1
MAGVLVIGGGPAGASFATRMAQLGAEVTIVEQLPFPRPRLGESLTPGTRDLLAVTGAWPLVEQENFLHARDVRLLWEDDAVIRLRAEAEGLLVDRGRFDQLLLDHAAREGVRVLQPAEILSRTSSGEGWDVLVAHDGGRELIRAGLLADARGRKALAGVARRAMGEKTLAIFADWRNEDFPTHATVAAGERSWFWGIPLPGGRYAAQAFVSPGDFHVRGTAGLEARYRVLIEGSALAEGLSNARIASAVQAIDATPYLAQEPISENVIRLGDAAMTLDPISSSGVQKAIQTALSGAIVANTMLRRPSTSQHALHFYRDSLAAAAARHAGWAAGHYGAAARGRSDPFWTARATPSPVPEDEPEEVFPEEVVALSPAARLADCACLGEEFVELRQALTHPSLGEPIAFLAHQPLAPLLASVPRGSLLALARAWSRRMPFETALSIALWLRRRRVLVPAAEAGPGAAA